MQQPPGVVDAAAPQSAPALAAQARAENFPVALRVLPAAVRGHLRAVYGVARVLDDLADEAEGDRTQLLTEFARDLERVWDGAPTAPVLQALVPTARALDLSPQPFRRLVEAGLTDQRVSRYETYDDLLSYCRMSADPVGRLVLAVLGVTGTRREVLSDQVCTALQLLEHWQDVGEDRRAGRVYLPQDDLRAAGVPLADLSATTTSTALRRLLELETERAAELLESGARLVGLLPGWARVAVAGYVAGGRATVTALRRAGFAVLDRPVRPRRRDVVAELARLLLAPPR